MGTRLRSGQIGSSGKSIIVRNANSDGDGSALVVGSDGQIVINNGNGFSVSAFSGDFNPVASAQSDGVNGRLTLSDSCLGAASAKFPTAESRKASLILKFSEHDSALAATNQIIAVDADGNNGTVLYYKIDFVADGAQDPAGTVWDVSGENNGSTAAKAKVWKISI